MAEYFRGHRKTSRRAEAPDLISIRIVQQINGKHDQPQRQKHNDRVHGVDLGRDAAPQGRIDVHGQRVVAAGEKERHRDFVE